MPACIKARYVFPGAVRAPTPHGQTAASAQQVQTRYLSIIIVADNGALETIQIAERNENGIIQSQVRRVRSRGAAHLDAPSLCKALHLLPPSPPALLPASFVFPEKGAIREGETGDISRD